MQKPLENVKKAVAPISRGIKARSPMKKLILIIVATVVGIVIVGTGVSIVGMYVGHWESPIVKDVAKVLPVPALTVNGHWRSYSEYLDAVATLDYSFNQAAVLQASGYTVKPSAQELRTMVLDRMAKEEIINQVAKKRGVSVTKADIDAEMKKLADQTGTEAQVAAQVQQLYKWDLATFRDKVIQPYLLRQHLQDNISGDATINADPAARAQAALARVTTGKEDFQTVAKAINEDATKSTGGDMGIYAKGEKDPLIEAAAFSLNVNETSNVIKALDGYYIIKVLEKIPADTKTSTPEKVHTAEIFIAVVPLDTWLYDQSKTQKVTLFLSGYKWDKDGARVVYSGKKSSTNGNTNTTANVNAAIDTNTTVNANTNAAASQ